jgi:hypothetical protein
MLCAARAAMKQAIRRSFPRAKLVQSGKRLNSARLDERIGYQLWRLALFTPPFQSVQPRQFRQTLQASLNNEASHTSLKGANAAALVGEYITARGAPAFVEPNSGATSQYELEERLCLPRRYALTATRLREATRNIFNG